jgi:oligoribonuclease (3'-5' exoribonuclease)
MTGLSPHPFGTDTILSVSCLITTADLTLLDTHGFDAIIHHSASQLSSMSPWCITTHGASGLTAQCLSSTTTAETAAADLLAYIQKHVPEKGAALLAGNSVHADKTFLMQKPWDPVVGWLHYRIFDVSAVKEMVRRWCKKEVLEAVPVKKATHTARKDIEESIEEARFYRGLLEKVTWS